MRTSWLLVAVMGLALAARGEAGPRQSEVFEIDFSNPGLSPSHWILTFHVDGSGHFRSERGSAPADDSQGIEAFNVDRDIRIGTEFAERAFQMAHRHKFFNQPCESHLKISFQGWKKISYQGPDGQGACEFNYSKDKEIQALGDSLVAVAGTILEGARLEMLLHHDRLGLDKEMEYLMEAAKDGRVQQICVIRGILERLAEDDEVMERVRKRARMLLAQPTT